MSGYKRVRDMDEDLSHESEERLLAMLAHCRTMGGACAVARMKKRQREYERQARRIERALSLNRKRGVATGAS